MYLRPTTENLANKSQKEEEGLLNADSTSESSEEKGVDDMDIQTYIRYGSEVCTLLGVLSYVIFQQGDEIKNQGLAAFTKQLVGGIIFIAKLVRLNVLFHRFMLQLRQFS